MSSLVLVFIAASHGALQIRLDVVRSPEAAECANGEWLARALAERLGRDLVDPQALEQVRVSFSRTNGQYVAVIERPLGAPGASRKMVSDSSQCEALSESVVLVLALTLDGTHRPRREPAAQPTLAPAPVQQEIAHPDPVPWDVSLSAGGGIGVGLGVGPAGVAFVRWALGLSAFHLHVDFTSLGPATQVLAQGRAETHALLANLVPCFQIRWFSACGTIAAGALRAQSLELHETSRRSLPFVLVGARALVDLPETTLFGFQLHVDALTPLTRLTLTVDNRPVWITPGFCFSIGLGLRFSLMTNGKWRLATTAIRS